MGTKKFAAELSIELRICVTVSKCVVVFSGVWNSFLKNTSWKKINFEAAKDKNVWTWTREMAEPTIFALVARPPFEVLNDCRWGLEKDED